MGPAIMFVQFSVGGRGSSLPFALPAMNECVISSQAAAMSGALVSLPSGTGSGAAASAPLLVGEMFLSP